MKRSLAFPLALLFLLASAAPVLAAADPGQVADEIRDDGVYVEPGSDLSEAEAGRLVAEARNQGERLSVVVLTDDPVSGAVAFGDAVADRLTEHNLLFVLTPSDVGVAGEGDVYTASEIEAALDAADAAGGSDTDYVTNFVATLTGTDMAGEPVPAETATTQAAETAASGSSSSGGGSGFIWFIVIVAIVGLGVVWLVRRSRKKADTSQAARIAEAKAAVQKQIDNIANDILDMADEVRLSENERVQDFFEKASATFTEASEQLPSIKSPEAILKLSNELDVAIWQLDSAEALLDGKPLPTKPEPKRAEPEPSPPDHEIDRTVPSPSYDRRPTRRSSYSGSGLLEILIGVAGQVMAGGRVRSRGGMFGGGMFGGGSRVSSRRSGSAVPTSRSRVRRTSSGSSSRGTGGRIRMGRKRRG